MRGGIRRIDLCGLPEQVERLPKARLATLVPVIATKETEVVRLEAARLANALRSRQVTHRQRPPDRLHDARGDVVLYRKDILDPAIVGLRPEMRVVAHANEL